MISVLNAIELLAVNALMTIMVIPMKAANRNMCSALII